MALLCKQFNCVRKLFRLYNEWENGRMGEWGRKTGSFSPHLLISSSPHRYFPASKPTRLIGVLIVVVLMVALSSDAQNSVKLEYKPKPGSILKYLMITDMTATIPVPTTALPPEIQALAKKKPEKLTPEEKAILEKASGTKLGMRSTLPFNQEVKSVDQQGVMDILITTGNVSIETDQNWQAIFGSDSMLAEGELKKMQITMRMDKKGKVIDFHIPNGKQMEEGVKAMFSRIVPTFPPHPLKVGDTWKAELSAVPKEFAMGSDATQQKSEVVYKLVGFEKYKSYNCAKITMTSDVDAKGSISPTGSPIPMTFKGKSTGTLLFAHQLGFIVKQDMQIDLTISITMPGMPLMQFLSKSVVRTELQN